MLRKEEGNVLREALNFEADGRRERSRPKSTWKRKAEEEIKRLDKGRCYQPRKMEEGSSYSLMLGMNEMNRATSVDGATLDLKDWTDDDHNDDDENDKSKLRNNEFCIAINLYYY